MCEHFAIWVHQEVKWSLLKLTTSWTVAVPLERRRRVSLPFTILPSLDFGALVLIPIISKHTQRMIWLIKLKRQSVGFLFIYLWHVVFYIALYFLVVTCLFPLVIFKFLQVALFLSKTPRHHFLHNKHRVFMGWTHLAKTRAMHHNSQFLVLICTPSLLF